MEKETLEWVRNLIKDQHRHVENANDEWYNRVAAGLFENETFNKVIMELYGAQYFGATKSGFRSDPKRYLLHELEMMIRRIEEEISKF